MYLAVKGFRSEKGTSSSVCFVVVVVANSSFSSLISQNTDMPRNSHGKQFPPGLHKFYATYLVFVSVEEGQFLIFPAFAKAKADSDSEKIVNLLF